MIYKICKEGRRVNGRKNSLFGRSMENIRMSKRENKKVGYEREELIEN